MLIALRKRRPFATGVGELAPGSKGYQTAIRPGHAPTESSAAGAGLQTQSPASEAELPGRSETMASQDSGAAQLGKDGLNAASRPVQTLTDGDNISSRRLILGE